HDAYLSYRSSSWGWGTWSDRWLKVDWTVSDFDRLEHDRTALARFARGGGGLFRKLKKQMAGELGLWWIRFAYAHFKHDATCLHPVRSRLRNIGFDGSGVHCGISNDFDVEIDRQRRPFTLPRDLAIDQKMLAVFERKFRPTSLQRAGRAARSLPGR